ncbi:MAG: DUF4269 domain-containing protein [Citrobacter freundii]|nr:MAG: DUF4269 domain-containing protein [Citrobacter freundii]
MNINFDDIGYLKLGTTMQQRAFQVLTTYRIMEKLAEFQPCLAGTIPLAIDMEGSDLDIICTWKNKQEFEDSLTNCFGEMDGFIIRQIEVRGELSVVANFIIAPFGIEIFGQAVPVKDQLAYRHMIIEYKLLAEKGEAFRKEIIQLKKNGLKTEPAFANILGLSGDPYLALLAFE